MYKIVAYGYLTDYRFDETWRNSLSRRSVNEGGPSYVSYYKNGLKKMEIWQANGGRHRQDGPAFALYHKDGSYDTRQFYLHGKPYLFPRYINFIKRWISEELYEKMIAEHFDLMEKDAQG